MTAFAARSSPAAALVLVRTGSEVGFEAPARNPSQSISVGPSAGGASFWAGAEVSLRRSCGTSRVWLFVVKPAATTRPSGVAALHKDGASRPAAPCRRQPASDRSRYVRAGMGGESEVWLSRPVYRRLRLGARVPFSGLQVAQRQPSRGPGTGPRIGLLSEWGDVELRAKKRRSRTDAGGILGLVCVARLCIRRVRGESGQRQHRQIEVGRILRIPRD
jgi:hypothetical protein